VVVAVAPAPRPEAAEMVGILVAVEAAALRRLGRLTAAQAATGPTAFAA